MLTNVINRYIANGEEPTQQQNMQTGTGEVPNENNNGSDVSVESQNIQNTQDAVTDNQSQPSENVDVGKDTDARDKKEPKRLEEMTNEELIGELKKWQRIAEERKTSLEKVQSKLSEVDVEALLDFVTKSKEDFWGTYKQYQDKLGLPSYEFVVSQTKVGDIDSQVEAYQNNVLVPEIMEKYGLEEFEFNPQDAWIPKTPSYEFRQRTEEYVKQLKSKFEEEKIKAEEFMRKVEEKKSKDIEELKKLFDSEDEFNEYFNKFNNPEDLSVLTDPDKHILSLKNLFRGYFFDELVERIVKREIEKVHKQYEKIGIKLPKNEVPLDVTNLKDNTVTQSVFVDDEKAKYSPLTRTLKRFVS